MKTWPPSRHTSLFRSLRRAVNTYICVLTAAHFSNLKETELFKSMLSLAMSTKEDQKGTHCNKNPLMIINLSIVLYASPILWQAHNVRMQWKLNWLCIMGGRETMANLSMPRMSWIDLHIPPPFFFIIILAEPLEFDTCSSRVHFDFIIPGVRLLESEHGRRTAQRRGKEKKATRLKVGRDWWGGMGSGHSLPLAKVNGY